MKSIIITVQNASELKLLEELARKMGFAAFELAEKDKRLLARRKFVELSSQFSKIDLTEEEILQEVKEVRAARYGKKKH